MIEREEAIRLLKGGSEGVKEWNRRREAGEEEMPDLSETTLSGANLTGANLFRTDLAGALLTTANLSAASLQSANLSYAFLMDEVDPNPWAPFGVV